MKRHFLSILLCLVSLLTSTAQVVSKQESLSEVSLQKANHFFQIGKYQAAVNLFKTHISQKLAGNNEQLLLACQKCILLKKVAQTDLKKKNYQSFLSYSTQILTINPSDSLTKQELMVYWNERGNDLVKYGRYTEALVRYQEALKYTVKGNALQVSTRSIIKINDYLKNRIHSDSLVNKNAGADASIGYRYCLLDFKKDQHAKFMLRNYSKIPSLRKNVNDLSLSNKSKALIQKCTQLQTILPIDSVSKQFLVSHYLNLANQKIVEKKYSEAITDYHKGEKYGLNDSLYHPKIAEVANQLKTLNQTVPPLSPVETVPIYLKPSNKTPLKIATAVVGITSEALVLYFNSQWNKKLTNTNNLAVVANNSVGDFLAWQNSYNDLKSYQHVQSIRDACQGLAIGSALLETYLLYKFNAKSKALKITPPNDGLGIDLNYHF